MRTGSSSLLGFARQRARARGQRYPPERPVGASFGVRRPALETVDAGHVRRKIVRFPPWSAKVLLARKTGTYDTRCGKRRPFTPEAVPSLLALVRPSAALPAPRPTSDRNQLSSALQALAARRCASPSIARRALTTRMGAQPARRRTSASELSGPGQCSRTSDGPPLRRRLRSTSATMMASSSWPATGMKSGTRSKGSAR